MKAENILMKNYRNPIIILLVIATGLLTAQSWRLATYNLLNFSGLSYTDLERVGAFKTVIVNMNPDILVVQEVVNKAALDVFLTDVLIDIPGKDFYAAPYHNGPDTDNGLFYNHNEFQYLSQDHFATNYRNMSRFRLLSLLEDTDTLDIYVMHLKAGSDSQTERYNETRIIRSELDKTRPGHVFFLCGDSNFYTAQEPGFQVLTGTGSDSTGQCYDPIDMHGKWHETPIFSSIHTQSTHDAATDPFSGGGLDDRFDFILVSSNLMKDGGYRCRPATYKAYGNDGVHFNKAVNAGDNGRVSKDIADALYAASDHLPVFMDFTWQPETHVNEASHIPEKFCLNAFPNPFNGQICITYQLNMHSSVSVNIYNMQGQLLTSLVNGNQDAGTHQIRWIARGLSGGSLQSGIYPLRMRIINSSGEFSLSFKLMLIQ